MVFAVLMLVSVSGRAADAAGIAWRTDFAKAVQESERLQKPVLVEVTASWCHYCRKMLTDTFADPGVVKRVSDCFIPVLIDADANPQLVERIGVTGLPTTVVVSTERKVTKRISGYKTTAALDAELAPMCPKVSAQDEAPRPERPRLFGNAKSAPPPYAFGKNCLVAALDEGKLTAGSTAHTLVYKGVTLCFASAEHRARFAANPEKYWPAWDGRCAVSAVDEGQTRQGDLRHAGTYRGRLWLFADENRYERFAAAPERYRAAAP